MTAIHKARIDFCLIGPGDPNGCNLIDDLDEPDKDPLVTIDLISGLLSHIQPATFLPGMT